MSEKEFENYVALIGKLLQLRRDEKELIGQELQDHLQMRVADLTSEGVSKDVAIGQALEEFGDAAVMAKNFQTVLELKRRRWMMRFATFSIAGVFLVAVLAMALWPTDTRFGSPDRSLAQSGDAGVGGDADSSATSADETGSDPSADVLSDATQRDWHTEMTLKKKASLNFDETPFYEVMDVLRERTNLNFLLHNSARDDSLTEDEPITFKINDMPLDKSIQLMLAEKNATYTIDEGIVLFISRDDDSDPDFERVKMFDCRELVAALPKTSVGAPQGGVLQGGGFGRGGNGMGGGMFMVLPQDVTANKDNQADSGGATTKAAGGFSSANNKAPNQSLPAGANSQPAPIQMQIVDQTSEHTLMNLVHNMVTPEDWEHIGGGARAEVVDGILVVCHSEAGLRKVENLLEDMQGLLLGKRAARMGMLNPSKPAITSNGASFGSSKTSTSSEDPFGNTSSDSFANSGNSTGDPFAN